MPDLEADRARLFQLRIRFRNGSADDDDRWRAVRVVEALDGRGGLL